ncbi:hypothetical protein B0H17DRAFT_1146152 [Mycena rosella]|uniref:Uncharacterized protein n=1 Tax=Mycena rosella TaxID=1033263 RepID=A0AAD7G1N3_MYCRO|nr:hypothetical protein B0H17DRAFT_1146152 [Mycena rosella]
MIHPAGKGENSNLRDWAYQRICALACGANQAGVRNVANERESNCYSTGTDDNGAGRSEPRGYGWCGGAEWAVRCGPKIRNPDAKDSTGPNTLQGDKRKLSSMPLTIANSQPDLEARPHRGGAGHSSIEHRAKQNKSWAKINNTWFGRQSNAPDG